MGESSGEKPHPRIDSNNRVPRRAKFALAATAAIATAGAAFGIFKAQEGSGDGGNRNLEPAVTRNAEEARDILLKIVEGAYAGRNIDKPNGAKYPDEEDPERLGQVPPVSHDLFHSAEGVKQILEACRTDGKPVTYGGKEYKIEQNFSEYRAAVLLSCEASAISLKWGYEATGDQKFRDAERNMYIIHKSALGVVKMSDLGLDDIVFNNNIKEIYRPVLGSDFVSQDSIKD